MKINKTNKKGFTIVELVIVIAVIAILAAVLIPTFSSLVKTAQTSSDISLVKNLNTSLTTSEILDGKNETMTDALNDVKEDGYDVTKLTPTNSDNDILWDEESNRFVLRIKDKYESCGSGVEVDEEKLYKLWKIYNEVEELESDPVYSIYWNLDADLPEGTKLSVGFDAGTTKNVSEVIYENTSSEAKEVIIRTNTVNTTLTVDALTDTINHYGNVGKVDVVKVDMNCYNEYGSAAYVKVTGGKVVAKDGGKINVLFANNDTSSNVVAITDGGLIEQGYTLADDAGSSNIELTTSTIEEVEKIAVDVIETAVEKEAVEADESDFWIVCHADEFASGSGTEQDPYIIKTARQLSLLAYNVNTLKVGFASAWYKLGKDIDLSGKAWTPIGTTNGENTIYFTGHFDGNGYAISGLTNNGKTAVDLGLYRSELSSVKGLAATYGLFGFVKDSEFKNVDIKSATIDGSSHFKQSGFIAGIAEGNITMTNCSIDSNCTLNGLSKVGGLIGEYINYGTGMNNKLGVFTDCSFAGSITATDRAGAIIGAVKTNVNNLYQFNQCVSTGSLTVEDYGVGLIGFKYQGSGGEEIEFPTFEYTECSIDLSKLTAPRGKGKYIGSIQHKTMLIIDSEYDNLAFGEINSIASVIALVFNDDMYMFKGSSNDVLLAISSLSETTYDIGQFWYDSTTTAWSSLTSYGDNMISFSGNFFVKINNSSYVIENSKIKVKGGELKLDTDSISLDEINSKFIAEGYVATLNHEGNGTTLKGYIVKPSK